MSLFDELLNDEKQINLALGALTSNVSSDWEKLGSALVLLLTDALKERLAALPPPQAPEPQPDPIPPSTANKATN
jgi:hypothetical protein